ncbi:MAG: acyltransferase, partial [Pyrinomonadaceae bacterium]|nr:acyltransferase [Pyrinomonadaceae bacterium]
MENFSNRIPSLDGLRTISIAFVIFAHFLHSLGIVDNLNLGNLGVRIFFVISGFLITGLLLKELDKTDKINLTKFYFRRTMRIFPPYYFFLFVMLALTLFGYFQISISAFLASFSYLSNYLDPNGWNLGHTWSLSVEEQFYLLFPSVLLFFGNRKTKIFLFLIIIFSPFIRYFDYISFGQTRWMGFGFHHNMDALGFGCLLALFYTKLHQNLYYQQFIKSKVIIIFPIIILSVNLLTERPRLFAVAVSIMNLSIAICIDWAVTNYQTIAGKALNSSPMIYLGGMSYSIYLWQQPFFENSESIWTKFPLN